MTRKERLSFREKNKDNKQWYKDMIEYISAHKLDEVQRMNMRVNNNLFNNKVDMREFEKVCMPVGEKVGKLPIDFKNRDIVSGKIKTVLGMEMQRPFSYRVFSTNPEATTAKEQLEFRMMRESIINEIMQPIRQQIEQQTQAQIQQLMQSPEAQDPNNQEQIQQQVQQIQQDAQEQEKQMTPEEVRKYMKRDYQDPAEVLSSQLLEYLKNKCKLKEKFSSAFKHGLNSAKSIMYVGIINDEPEVWVVNPERFNYQKSADTIFIEDAEWAVCEYRMSPSQIANYFNNDLSDKDLDRIYSSIDYYTLNQNEDLFYEIENNESNLEKGISVYHCVWKALRKIGFLAYMDENGEEQSMLVDESYKIEVDASDISIEWEWIPEVYEGWKIDTTDSIYIKMQPVPGQFKDLDNLRYCKLPYYGVVYDSYENESVSLMDRLKNYQYLYNIIMYRLELLLSSDKGKKLLMSINNIPDSLGMTVDEWQYYVESSPYIWYNPSEEGSNTVSDANNVAKVMDLSLTSDIKKYIEIAEYVKQQCGKSVGITEQVEGQIGQYEAVRNTNQALIQSSYILEPYFSLNDSFKVNILTALLETAKVCYSQNEPRKLSYMLDDLSKEIINLDPVLLDNSTLGIFVSSSTKAEQTKELIHQLSQAALQTQTVEFSDIIAIMSVDSVPEAKEILEAAQEKRKEEMEKQQQQQYQQQMEMQKQQEAMMDKQFQQNKELTILREEERRKTEIAKMSIMGASYNPDEDKDNDGKNDFLEIAGLNLDMIKANNDKELKDKEFKLKEEMERAKSVREDKKVENERQANKMRRMPIKP